MTFEVPHCMAFESQLHQFETKEELMRILGKPTYHHFELDWYENEEDPTRNEATIFSLSKGRMERWCDGTIMDIPVERQEEVKSWFPRYKGEEKNKLKDNFGNELKEGDSVYYMRAVGFCCRKPTLHRGKIVKFTDERVSVETEDGKVISVDPKKIGKVNA